MTRNIGSDLPEHCVIRWYLGNETGAIIVVPDPLSAFQHWLKLTGSARIMRPFPIQFLCLFADWTRLEVSILNPDDRHHF